ncbi:MAG: HAD-IA family hydrolase [SAR202 cluster bacterium]|jgi:putative hydrolase of the HAD superfamily|nr:HAD-IA family hydrolase [SAR202 cluster bacterium]
MIKAIFFDLYGTLAGFQPTRYEIQSEACAAFGISVTPEGILRGYAVADAYMSQQSAVKPLRSLDRDEQREFFAEYEKRVLRGCDVEVSNDQAIEIWRRIREIPYQMERFDDVLPTMDLLKQQGLILGLLSNLNRNGDDLAESMGLTPYLDFAVTSAEIGSEKPHAPMFLAALEKAGSAPLETVHVGDQITSDIEGATNVGINPVLVDRDGNHQDTTLCPRIETLMELPPLVSEY